MPGRTRQYFAALILWMGVTASLYGQVSPSQINRKLLLESIDAVLGAHQKVEWQKVTLTDLNKGEIRLRQQRSLPDTVFIGHVQTEEGERWIIPDIAPSRSETFSFVLYLDEQKRIVDVDVLEYRESYGYEIDYPFFREQFHDKSDPKEIRFGRSIQNISGATISARSLTYAVHDLLSIIKNIKLK